MEKKALLLMGSPRGDKSNSASLGNYLVSKLEKLGMSSETLNIHHIFHQEQEILNLMEKINHTDLIILTFPLYVDSFPAPVIRIMELIHEHRSKTGHQHQPDFIAITNSGFPELIHMKVVLDICKVFCRDCGFNWKGGIRIGAGDFFIHGRPLKVKHLCKGLDIAATALLNNREIPLEAIESITKKQASPLLYLIFINFGFYLQIHKKPVMLIGLIAFLFGLILIIFGVTGDNIVALNLGIPFAAIGINMFIHGLVFFLQSKK
jgi:hypothetical protein